MTINAHEFFFCFLFIFYELPRLKTKTPNRLYNGDIHKTMTPVRGVTKNSLKSLVTTYHKCTHLCLIT